MDGPLEWIAAIGTMMAAGLVAADLGRKVTGYGFVLFCAVSITCRMVVSESLSACNSAALTRGAPVAIA